MRVCKSIHVFVGAWEPQTNKQTNKHTVLFVRQEQNGSYRANPGLLFQLHCATQQLGRKSRLCRTAGKCLIDCLQVSFTLHRCCKWKLFSEDGRRVGGIGWVKPFTDCAAAKLLCVNLSKTARKPSLSNSWCFWSTTMLPVKGLKPVSLSSGLQETIKHLFTGARQKTPCSQINSAVV